MIRRVFLRKSLSFGAAHIKKRFCMRDWANVSVHAFSVVHGYNVYMDKCMCAEKNCSASVKLVMLYAVSIVRCGAM